MGFGVNDPDELHKIVDERRRASPDLDKLADDDAMREVRTQLLQISQHNNQARLAASMAVTHAQDLFKQYDEDGLKDKSSLKKDSGRLRSAVTGLDIEISRNNFPALDAAVGRALNIIQDREADYALRTDRLKLERARADISSIIVQSFPVGTSGKLLVQIGAALLGAVTAGSALTQFLAAGQQPVWWHIGLTWLVAFAMIFGGLWEIRKREAEQREKFEELLGSVVIHEPPRSYEEAPGPAKAG